MLVRRLVMIESSIYEAEYWVEPNYPEADLPQPNEIAELGKLMRALRFGIPDSCIVPNLKVVSLGIVPKESSNVCANLPNNLVERSCNLPDVLVGSEMV